MKEIKTGLFFGSFNPIHIGHLIIASTLMNEPELKEIWFVVSPRNPHKLDDQSLAGGQDRFDMVQQAVQDDPRFRPVDVEFHLPQPNYTIDTLTHLSGAFPDHRFVVIVGEDNLDSFPRWKNYEAILGNYGLLVYPRPGSGRSIRHGLENVRIIPAPLLDISASRIRQNIRERKTVKYLVPDGVLEIIMKRGLYR